MAVERPPGVAHPAFGLAGLCALGGGVGAARGSRVSLLAGLALGGAFAFAGSEIQQGRAQEGYRWAMASSSLLSGAMMFRLVRTRKIMPAGLLACVGAWSSAWHYDKLLEYDD
jgi:uncharacterized membrane protein (UPF0136 family)